MNLTEGERSQNTHAFSWDTAKRPLERRTGFLVDTVKRMWVFALGWFVDLVTFECFWVLFVVFWQL
jgi:hypothetical protein